MDINLHVVADYNDADAVTIRAGQVVGDSLYLLVSGLYSDSDEGQTWLERWTAGMSEPETVLKNLLSYRSEDADAAMPVVSRLITDGKSVYGYDDMTGQLVRLVDESGSAKVESLCTLETAEEEKSADGVYYGSYVSAMFAQDGEVVRLAENYGDGESSMVVERYALDTGKLIARSGADNTMRTMCSYKDGKYLALVQPIPGPEAVETPMSQIAVYDPRHGCDDHHGDPGRQLPEQCDLRRGKRYRLLLLRRDGLWRLHGDGRIPHQRLPAGQCLGRV